MKLLKVVANNFKLCDKDFTISFVPTGNKTEAHKEFELQEIDDNLYTFTTLGIIGKNASGKTTVVADASRRLIQAAKNKGEVFKVLYLAVEDSSALMTSLGMDEYRESGDFLYIAKGFCWRHIETFYEAVLNEDCKNDTVLDGLVEYAQENSLMIPIIDISVDEVICEEKYPSRFI